MDAGEVKVIRGLLCRVVRDVQETGAILEHLGSHCSLEVPGGVLGYTKQIETRKNLVSIRLNGLDHPVCFAGTETADVREKLRQVLVIVCFWQINSDEVHHVDHSRLETIHELVLRDKCLVLDKRYRYNIPAERSVLSKRVLQVPSESNAVSGEGRELGKLSSGTGTGVVETSNFVVDQHHLQRIAPVLTSAFIFVAWPCQVVLSDDILDILVQPAGLD